MDEWHCWSQLWVSELHSGNGAVMSKAVKIHKQLIWEKLLTTAVVKLRGNADTGLLLGRKCKIRLSHRRWRANGDTLVGIRIDYMIAMDIDASVLTDEVMIPPYQYILCFETWCICGTSYQQLQIIKWRLKLWPVHTGGSGGVRDRWGKPSCPSHGAGPPIRQKSTIDDIPLEAFSKERLEDEHSMILPSPRHKLTLILILLHYCNDNIFDRTTTI